MSRKYKTLYEGGCGEVVEKKSRFIAHTALANSEEEAICFIQNIRKQYLDARHHCFAYVIGERNEIERCNDDGEPARTAGKPILDVILGLQLCNVVVVVTRYFGGTLLGTGGLIRAYSGAAKEGLKASRVITKIYGKTLKVWLAYTGQGKLQYWFMQNHLTILDTIYTDEVCMEIVVPEGQYQEVEQSVKNETNGNVRIEWGEQRTFSEVDGAITVLK